MSEDFLGPGWGRYFRDRYAQPFFAREEYERVRSTVADPQNLPPDYDSFLEQVRQLDYQAKERGIVPTRVYIELDMLRRFCAERRIQITVKACSTYADAMLDRFKR
jgi:hypothetical protein